MPRWTPVECERGIGSLQANVTPSVIAQQFDAMQGRLNLLGNSSDNYSDIQSDSDGVGRIVLEHDIRSY